MAVSEGVAGGLWGGISSPQKDILEFLDRVTPSCETATRFRLKFCGSEIGCVLLRIRPSAICFQMKRWLVYFICASGGLRSTAEWETTDDTG